jgi:hypothetical protein
MIPLQLELISALQRFSELHPKLLRFRACNPYTDSRAIYVHSKVLLVDEDWLSIGSANFAERAFRIDTELMLTLEATHPQERWRIRRLGEKLESHWKNLVAIPLPLQPPLFKPRAWVDPGLPLFYRTRRRLAQRRRSERPWTGPTIAWIAGFSPIFIWITHHFAGTPRPIAATLAAGTYSCWLLPAPSVALGLLMLLHPGEPTELLVILCFWSATLISTLWARVLPSSHRSWAEKHGVELMPDFGRRKFSSLLLAWLEPGRSVLDKLHSQAHYMTPVPWILLVNGLLVGALIHATAQALRLLEPLR